MAYIVSDAKNLNSRFKFIAGRTIREGMQGKASPSQAGIEYTGEHVAYIRSMYLSRLPLMCSFSKANVQLWKGYYDIVHKS